MRICKYLYVAAFMFFCAGAHPLFGTINYTPVNKVIPNGTTFPIDFNHDGAIDFSIKSLADLIACGSVRQGLQGFVNLSPARSTTRVILKGEYAAALPSGVAVGPTLIFALGKTYLTSFHTCGGFESAGNWYNVSNHFLGVQFGIAGQLHYGWIELSVTADRSALTTVVVGFAYETVAGKAIVTGQTGVPSACSLPSTDQTVHICSPVAGSTVSTPVAISAKAKWDSHTIQHMRVYVDNVDRFDLNSPVGGAIKTTLSLTPGSHHLVVTAWDTSGHVIQSGETFTSK